MYIWLHVLKQLTWICMDDLVIILVVLVDGGMNFCDKFTFRKIFEI